VATKKKRLLFFCTVIMFFIALLWIMNADAQYKSAVEQNMSEKRYPSKNVKNA